MWIILLDRSSSMGHPFKGALQFAGRTRRTDAAIKLDAARQAIAEHLHGLGTPSRVVLIAFDARPEIVYDGLSNVHDAIASALEGITAQGGTNIAAALSAATSVVQQAVHERVLRA